MSLADFGLAPKATTRPKLTDNTDAETKADIARRQAIFYTPVYATLVPFITVLLRPYPVWRNRFFVGATAGFLFHGLGLFMYSYTGDSTRKPQRQREK